MCSLKSPPQNTSSSCIDQIEFIWTTELVSALADACTVLYKCCLVVWS